MKPNSNFYLKSASSKTNIHQYGFSLIELLVGMVIGLIATLVIMQVFSVFEGQKRSTTGTADAQVNGSIALYNIQRQVQMAGFGLPLFDATDTTNNSPLKCTSTLIDNDGNTATAAADLFPISIVDGGATGNDRILVSYFSGPNGGLATSLNSRSGQVLNVGSAIGCVGENTVTGYLGDTVLVVNGTTCSAGRVKTVVSPTAVGSAHSITLTTSSTATSMAGGSRVSCLGTMNNNTFRINANQLELNTTPLTADIVSMQAQYGVSAVANSNQVTSWESAVGAWATPSQANRNRIRAIRLAIVARNGSLEKTNVTTAAPTSWAGGPAIDLSADGNWQRYRYRTFETVIPLRNMTWNGDFL